MRSNTIAGLPRISGHGFQVVPGWPIFLNGNSVHGGMLVDMDGDPELELFQVLAGTAQAFNPDGSAVAGWPKPLNYPCYIPASVVDLDGDGWLDILTGDVILSPTPVNPVYAWDRLGNPLAGFPIKGLDALHGQIIIVDFDDDGLLELTFDQNLGNSDYMGYNHDGTAMAGWPLPVQGSSFLGCLSVNDFDGNGKMDLAGSGGLIQQGDTYLYLWTSDFPYAKSRAPLPTYQYNLRRDGIADPMAMALATDTDTISSQGGTVEYYLDASTDNAGRNYLLLGSVSGTDSGTQLPGGQATLPLNWDLFTMMTVVYANTPVFKAFMGSLDQIGKAGAQLILGPVPGFLNNKDRLKSGSCLLPYAREVSNEIPSIAGCSLHANVWGVHNRCANVRCTRGQCDWAAHAGCNRPHPSGKRPEKDPGEVRREVSRVRNRSLPRYQ